MMSTRPAEPQPAPSPAVPTPALVTTEVAARALSVSPRFVRRLIAERRIVFYRLGRAVRIDVADLAAYIESRRVEPITASRVAADLRRAA